MRPSRRSSGVATDDAIVSGLAPGICALTWSVGKIDPRQRGDGQPRERSAPANSRAAASSDVATAAG